MIRRRLEVVLYGVRLRMVTRWAIVTIGMEMTVSVKAIDHNGMVVSLYTNLKKNVKPANISNDSSNILTCWRIS